MHLLSKKIGILKCRISKGPETVLIKYVYRLELERQIKEDTLLVGIERIQILKNLFFLQKNLKIIFC